MNREALHQLLDPDNLEPVTRGENHRHAYRIGLRGGPSLAAKLADEVSRLRAKGLSFAQVAAELGVSQTTAFRAANAGRVEGRAA